jgi:hypothetical protein
VNAASPKRFNGTRHLCTKGLRLSGQLCQHWPVEHFEPVRLWKINDSQALKPMEHTADRFKGQTEIVGDIRPAHADDNVGMPGVSRGFLEEEANERGCALQRGLPAQHHGLFLSSRERLGQMPENGPAKIRMILESAVEPWTIIDFGGHFGDCFCIVGVCVCKVQGEEISPCGEPVNLPAAIGQQPENDNDPRSDAEH